MRLIAILVFIFIGSPLHADVYKWVDADGRVHYSENPPVNAEAKKLGRPKETTEEETPESQQARLEAIVKEAGIQKKPVAAGSAGCEEVLFGKWGVTYTSKELFKEKQKEEMPNHWTFNADGSVAISLGGFLNLNEKFHCEGKNIHIDRGAPSVFEVQRLEANELVWWDKDPEKYFYLEKIAASTAEPAKLTPEQQKMNEMAKALAESIVSANAKDHRDPAAVATLDCEKAVINARDGVDTMLSIGQKNVDDGLADKTSYEKTAGELRKAKARISKTECKAATGDVKGFYECMMDDYNHVAMCAEKYKYWDANLFPKRF